MSLFASCKALSAQTAYDFVVIGAGSGGCAAAGGLVKAFAGTGAKILLLEAGPTTDSMFVRVPLLAAGPVGQYPIARKYNWGLESIVQRSLIPPRTSYIPRGCGLGGSSAINAMIYIRGHPDDYDWGAGWSFEDVLPQYTAMEGNTVFTKSRFHGADGSLMVSSPSKDTSELPYNVAFKEATKRVLGIPANDDFNDGDSTSFGVGDFQHTSFQGERVSAWDAHCAPLIGQKEHTETFHVAPNSMVSTLELDPSGRKIIAVRCVERNANTGAVDYHSERRIVVGREAVVALGAIHTPPLLQRSGIGSEEDLRRIGLVPKVRSEEVGKNLMDHFDVTLVLKTKSFTESRAVDIVNPVGMTTQVLRYVKQRTGTWSNVVEAGAFFHSDRRHNALSISEQKQKKIRPNVQLHFLPGPLINHARVVPLYNGYSMHVCNLYPTSRGTVVAPSTDITAQPLVDFNYLATREDIDVTREACAAAMEIVSANAFSQYKPTFVNPTPDTAARILDTGKEGKNSKEKAIEEMMRRHGDNIYHPMGTCSMGRVVDTSLRVYGVDNLRIADASVIATPFGGNTNAPCQMIGARCAQFVHATHAGK